MLAVGASQQEAGRMPERRSSRYLTCRRRSLRALNGGRAKRKEMLDAVHADDLGSSEARLSSQAYFSRQANRKAA